MQCSSSQLDREKFQLLLLFQILGLETIFLVRFRHWAHSRNSFNHVTGGPAYNNKGTNIINIFNRSTIDVKLLWIPYPEYQAVITISSITSPHRVKDACPSSTCLYVILSVLSPFPRITLANNNSARKDFHFRPLSIMPLSNQSHTYKAPSYSCIPRKLSLTDYVVFKSITDNTPRGTSHPGQGVS